MVLIAEALPRLLKLSRISKLSKDQTKEAVKLMKSLREDGLSNRDIFIAVKKKWKIPTIKKYTRGINTKSTDERDLIMQTFTQFVVEGHTVQDAVDFLKLDRGLKDLGLSSENIIKMSAYLLQNKSDINNLMNLSNELEKSKSTVQEMLKVKEDMEDLKNRGIDKEGIIQLKLTFQKYGGFKEILEALSQYDNIALIKREEDEINKRILKKESELTILGMEENRTRAWIQSYSTYVEMAKVLCEKYSFDVNSLTAIIEMAAKHGSSIGTINAINTYNSLQEIREEIIKATKDSELLKNEISLKESELDRLQKFIEQAKRDIGEIKAKHGESLRLQAISNLLMKARKMTLEPDEFMRIALALISGITEYANTNLTTLGDWKKQVKPVLDLAVMGLTTILSK